MWVGFAFLAFGLWVTSTRLTPPVGVAWIIPPRFLASILVVTRASSLPWDGASGGPGRTSTVLSVGVVQGLFGLLGPSSTRARRAVSGLSHAHPADKLRIPRVST